MSERFESHRRACGVAWCAALLTLMPACTDSAGPEPDGVLALAAGEYHSCATLSAGATRCWGYNTNGQIGNSSTLAPPVSLTSSPLQVDGGERFDVLALGVEHSCGLSNGQLYCWGSNHASVLGLDNSTGRALTPVRVPSVPASISLAAGRLHSCAVSTAFAAYCWGFGGDGQLGVDSVPVVVSLPREVAGHQSFMTVTAGYRHTCAISRSGRAYCWGDNALGQLGVSSNLSICMNGTECSPQPAPVDGDLDFVALAAGGMHTCGIAADSTAYCWGAGALGQLGTSAPDRCGYAAEPCARAPQPVIGSDRFISISAGGGHTCALTPDGSAKCWGGNASGQLGTGAVTDSIVTPTDVATDRKFRLIAAGGTHTCAVTLAGELYCWGDGSVGQVGAGEPRGSYPAPVLIDWR